MLEKLKNLQIEMAKRVNLVPLKGVPQFIAGCDVGYLEDRFSIGVFVIMKYPEFELVEIVKIAEKIEFPYIPGFLAFREAPVLLKAFQKLKRKPQLVFVDGQGIAHPRKAGLAVHLGVTLQIPTIGCAKKPLLKYEGDLSYERGASFPIIYQRELVGYVVRTKPCVKPVFVSPGNLITTDEAKTWVLKTAKKFRIPEPLRLAHKFSKDK